MYISYILSKYQYMTFPLPVHKDFFRFYLYIIYVMCNC